MRSALFLIMLLSATSMAAGNLFPDGDFSCRPDEVSVKDGVKDKKYSCAVFLPEKRFLLYYADTAAAEDGKFPSVTLDKTEKLRDANFSIKCVFSGTDNTKLHRISLLLPKPMKMNPGKIYEADVYIKSSDPDLKFAISIMGSLFKENGQKDSYYKFFPFNSSTMWKPFTAVLKSPESGTAEFNMIVLDVNSKADFHIGKICLTEKEAAD